MIFRKLISALALTSVVSGAIAMGANAQSVYKDPNGAIYATGLTPSTSTEFVFSSINQSRSVVANSCGAISLRGTSTSPLPATIIVAGTSINVSSLPVQLLPTCTAGSWNVTPSENFRTSTGQVVIIGQTPNTALSVSYYGSAIRRANANLCGSARIAPSGSFTPSGPFTITGQSGTFDVATLTQKANPDICRNGVTYVAQ
ncbi:MAG: hypothetical protein IM535_15025 [Pseudanabaena sp. M38BS1SP1A06MG]|uniref:hypothetical protein n=1 Tax=Pseudanabaena mucicola TaxID=71190 RepID=UPI0025780317|nr:hypothetical protein [Pseudanabaena mucicola]MCA6593377.1 hypothetical protein [Pseudanabaena sp. M38BS1SP1A06MG]